MKRQDADLAAALVKAFSHPTRLSILAELATGPKCVNDMEELLPARQANISQHLTVLRHAKLVDFSQDGTLRCYYLCRENLVKDMLAIAGRNDPVVTLTSAEIRNEKKRLAAKTASKRKLPQRASARS